MNAFAKLPSLISTDRLCNLIKYSALAPKDSYILECGIYQAGSLEVLAKYNTEHDIVAIDSFEGLPESNPQKDFHRAGEFNEVDFYGITGYFRMLYQRVRIIKGFIPKAFEYFEDNVRFGFSHVDLDLYESVKTSCEFIFPHTVSNGIILFDDYKCKSTRGATEAIDEYFSDKECLFKGELFYYEGGKSHYQYLVVVK